MVGVNETVTSFDVTDRFSQVKAITYHIVTWSRGDIVNL